MLCFCCFMQKEIKKKWLLMRSTLPESHIKNKTIIQMMPNVWKLYGRLIPLNTESMPSLDGINRIRNSVVLLVLSLSSQTGLCLFTNTQQHCSASLTKHIFCKVN